MTALIFRASYASRDEFLRAFDAEVSQGGLLVRGAVVGPSEAMAECAVRVEVAGSPPVEVPARVASVVPGVGVAVMFGDVPEELAQLARPSPPADRDEPRGTAGDRIKALNASQKMALAIAGDREERFALLRDTNKAVHVFIFKNPRITIDEVQNAAKMPGLSPDALKMIAEHREWSANPGICTALVRNPKTPLPLALRLLDRIPASEVRVIAKGGARDQLVQAARKKLNG